jgi:CRP-like cAMP-binding protein
VEGAMLESRYLKDNIENIQKLLTIPALRNFEAKSLGRLLNLSKIREYEDGEQIIKEGDFDPWLYFLLSGKIRITKEGLEINSIDKKGEIFGEMAWIFCYCCTEFLPNLCLSDCVRPMKS